MSDAAKYVVVEGAILKSLYPELFHVACTAYLLHNCAAKAKSHFEDVDQLIAKVKLATIKNKTRQAKVATIDCTAQPVVTRWES